eukprot:873561-Ditylum_brightwellii.AAC.1
MSDITIQSKQNMRYVRDQQVEWTPAVVTHYYDNPPHVVCLVASHPFVQFPVLFSSWQTTRKIDIANMRPLEVDAAAGIGV